MITPKLTDSTLGGTAHFTCHINGFKTWSHNHHKLPTNSIVSGYNNEILTLYNISSSDSGYYFCVGTGLYYYDIGEANLRIYSK